MDILDNVIVPDDRVEVEQCSNCVWLCYSLGSIFPRKSSSGVN
jgi:hypothetical protein